VQRYPRASLRAKFEVERHCVEPNASLAFKPIDQFSKPEARLQYHDDSSIPSMFGVEVSRIDIQTIPSLDAQIRFIY